ncbi:MAG: hypothetical protein ABI763_02395 [Bacteroidota bacterium]
MRITKSTDLLQLSGITVALTVVESLRSVSAFRNLLPGKSELRVTALLVTTAETFINVDLRSNHTHYKFFAVMFISVLKNETVSIND